MKSTNEQLRELIAKQDLTIHETARLAGLSLDTIKAYLTSSKSKRFRHAPEGTLKYLQGAIERKANIVSRINDSFNVLVNEMEQFLLEEYGEDIQKIGILQKKTSLTNNAIGDSWRTNISSLKKFQSLLTRVNDLWIDYIELDLDGSIHKSRTKENEELQKIAELHNIESHTEESKKRLTFLMNKHKIIAATKSTK